MVHGERGSDPTEPPASGPYPYPAVSHEPRIQRLADDMARTGLRPFPLPVGVMLDESDRMASRCVRCQWFDGFPCLVDGKADADVLAVRPALEHDNVTLLTRARVERIETDATGRTATDVVVDHHGERETYRGDIVVVSCGAVNSAALLLRSASEQHPNGLANSSDVVGRHYMAHINSAMIALSREPNLTKLQKTLGVNDYSRRQRLLLGGGGLRLPARAHPDARQDRRGDAARGRTAAHARNRPRLRRPPRHRLLAHDRGSAAPREPGSARRSGNIHLHDTDRNTEGHRRLLAKLKKRLGHLGCYERLVPNVVSRDERIPIAGVAHQCGTVRFGNDPTASVLDPNCKAHDLDNLYVVDTSFFPSASAVNPALTAMANALRVGDHLLDRLDARSVVPDEIVLPVEEPA